MGKSRLVAITFIALLTGCCSSYFAMTDRSFCEIEMGVFINEIQCQVGDPYAICIREDGAEEYQYIERIDLGNGLVMEKHYFLIVKDDRVISKRLVRRIPPAYNLLYETEPNYPSYNYPLYP
ncbi:hypothetical protein [Candidatus Rhabdochlamydia sp. T3358]|uniref:hypothetical protein n=1 Tax=Candidatus Rhabdochlamydia sp. T3358 TaxID=2099795 RepID=UPI0010B3BF01|nr:hypothetical protein [Candidatus Rhabdochlamydia sp. T3358]VHO00844.1 hypothetical protein RHT_00196 [Candidatus Rhabdochlamydia sp. T3358]